MWTTAGGLLLGTRTHTRNVEPGAFLSLYKIAHSVSMVDKWDNFAFRLLHNQRSPLRTRGH
jgi:hypothetical protein